MRPKLLSAMKIEVGMSCYIVASIAKVSPEEVFKGDLPYFAMSMVLLCLLIFFPGLATWLPNLYLRKSPGVLGDRRCSNPLSKT